MKLRVITLLALTLPCLCRLCAAAPPAQGSDARPGQERREPPAAERKHEEGKPRDDERRPPKLSPEERRALRQQIHEAGHDLYRPKQ